MRNLKELCKKNSFKIEGGYRPGKIDNIHEHMGILNSGCGSHKPKKGKGSYSRKGRNAANRGFHQ